MWQTHVGLSGRNHANMHTAARNTSKHASKHASRHAFMQIDLNRRRNLSRPPLVSEENARSPMEGHKPVIHLFVGCSIHQETGMRLPVDPQDVEPCMPVGCGILSPPGQFCHDQALNRVRGHQVVLGLEHKQGLLAVEVLHVQLRLLPEEAAAHKVANEQLRQNEVLDAHLHGVHARVRLCLDLVSPREHLQEQEAHGVDERALLHVARLVPQHPRYQKGPE
mmetsp:Transcript_59381/g.176652  ORF Transcript_59381/g.176652 Transcript_59381/m.176652 type:complete len:222 (-) Transcript_59381:1602-2267(-)